MKDKRKVLIFCMIFVGSAAFCQYSSKITIHSSLSHAHSLSTILPLPASAFLQLLPGNFSTSQLGFFCKQEWKFESATRVPFKFRLGNVGYCDWLEGNKPAGLLPVR